MFDFNKEKLKKASEDAAVKAAGLNSRADKTIDPLARRAARSSYTPVIVFVYTLSVGLAGALLYHAFGC